MKYYKGKHLVNDNLPPGGIYESDTWEYEEKDGDFLYEIIMECYSMSNNADKLIEGFFI